MSMKRGKGRRAPDSRVRTRGRVRFIWLLIIIGLLSVAAAPCYALWGTLFSGHQVLHQQIAAANAVGGFEFGPVYLEKDIPGRYFVKMLVPVTGENYWHTSFEVLNDQGLPVFHQDELRFIGDFQFRAGETDTFQQVFQLGKQTGYYYFRFTSLNGEYPANLTGPPVVEFSVRQGVLAGMQIWGPLAGILLLGLLCMVVAARLIRALGEELPAHRAHPQPEPAAPLERRGLRMGLKPRPVEHNSR